MTKQVEEQSKWGRVADELEAEDLKLQSYDKTLLELLGNLDDKAVLDYGAGPGVLALTLSKLGANVKVYDLSEEMQTLAGEKIGNENVYKTHSQIPNSCFDYVICNLVMCIVEEQEVANISRNIKAALKNDGTAYVGFCNPKIFDVPESALDFRDQNGNSYDDNHIYWKTKKEGGYRIVEMHRPIEWYKDVFKKAGLEVANVHFTPEYELNDKKIQDFVIFELSN